MLRRILDSPWLYFGLAGVLVLVLISTMVEIRLPSRPQGQVEELAELRDRDDLNVVFILIDTLRADRLGAYGYERPTSPVMDSLAATGIRFAHVESQSSFTKVSMASLWTGMYPERTGVLRFRHAMPPEAVMPAEILQEAGFRTAGIWRNGWVAPNFQFDQGFDLYIRPKPSRTPERLQRHSPGSSPLQGTDLDATQSAIEFIKGNVSERFFLYIHYMDVHQYVYDETSTKFGTTYSDSYDNAILWTDRNVGFVLGALQEEGLLDRTLVVIASDHAEGFYEHGTEGHARTLYREVTEVPLIFVLPFRLESGLLVEERIANVDIWPTILDLLGLPELPGAEGRSVVPLIEAAAGGGAPDVDGLVDRPIFAQLDRTWGREGAEPNPIVSIVSGPYRMIHHVKTPEKVELYDRTSDELERRNVAQERPEEAAELRAVVEEFLARPRTQWDQTPEVEIDEMRKHQLRALGYMVDEKGELQQDPEVRVR